MTRPTVLLFDIDGTLVTTGGAGRRAFENAFAHLHGRPDACEKLRFDGNTDRWAARFGLETIGQVVNDAAIDALLETYTLLLREELARTAPDACRVYPGVVAAVEAALGSGAAVGLGTGNTQEGARLKLEHFDLYRHFEFGGFGSDHELRVEIIRRGAERGAARLGHPLAECRVVVIGDTPKDIDAARGIGAEALAVGTGSYGAAELLAHGATWAFDDLSAEGVLDALLSR